MKANELYEKIAVNRNRINTLCEQYHFTGVKLFKEPADLYATQYRLVLIVKDESPDLKEIKNVNQLQSTRIYNLTQELIKLLSCDILIWSYEHVPKDQIEQINDLNQVVLLDQFNGKLKEQMVECFGEVDFISSQEAEEILHFREQEEEPSGYYQKKENKHELDDELGNLLQQMLENLKKKEQQQRSEDIEFITAKLASISSQCNVSYWIDRTFMSSSQQNGTASQDRVVNISGLGKKGNF